MSPCAVVGEVSSTREFYVQLARLITAERDGYYQETTDMDNLFTDIPETLKEELTETLVHTNSMRIERIVSHGHASPPGFWYDQQEHEWVVVLQGTARLRFEDELVVLKSGDFLNIPAHRKHRIEWTTPDEPTIWLAVFYTASSTGSKRASTCGCPPHGI